VPPAMAALFQPCVASVRDSAAGVQVPAGIGRLQSFVRGAWLCNVVSCLGYLASSLLVLQVYFSDVGGNKVSSTHETAAASNQRGCKPPHGLLHGLSGMLPGGSCCVNAVS
jgi:hypothetical protein